MEGDPRRVVVFAPNWLGDAVMALPALDDVRRRWPMAHLAVAARAKLAPLFEWVPGIDEVVALPDRNGLLARLRPGRAAPGLAAGRYELAVLLPNSFHSAWMARHAAIPERWGYRRDGRGRLLTRAIRRPRSRRHMAEYYQGLTASLGMENGPRVARVNAPPDGRARGRALLAAQGWTEGSAPIVGVAPGAAYGRAKRWLPERFAGLALALAKKGISTVFVGARSDLGTGAEIERALEALGGPASSRQAGAAAPGPRLINLIGQTDLAALAGLMAECRSFVSNDSGAMHLAAAVGTPVTAIFGASDEHGTSPLPHASIQPEAAEPPGHVILTHPVWCRPCMLRECPLDHGCMAGVTAEAVLDAVLRQAQQGSGITGHGSDRHGE